MLIWQREWQVVPKCLVCGYVVAPVLELRLWILTFGMQEANPVLSTMQRLRVGAFLRCLCSLSSLLQPYRPSLQGSQSSSHKWVQRWCMIGLSHPLPECVVPEFWSIVCWVSLWEYVAIRSSSGSWQTLSRWVHDFLDKSESGWRARLEYLVVEWEPDQAGFDAAWEEYCTVSKAALCARGIDWGRWEYAS